MRFYFSWRTSSICFILAAGMLRASWWQYTRYEEKKSYIETMTQRLAQPVAPILFLLADHADDPQKLAYRRTSVSGTFDFEHEMVLRNRRLGQTSGVFVLTPLLLDNMPSPTYLLVSRGFVPLAKASPETRKEFHRIRSVSFTGLLKESAYQKFLAPSDPPSGPELPWVDQWLRVDIPRISAQLPYKLLPVYAEIMETAEQRGVQEKILESQGGREELFYLGESRPLSGVEDVPALSYPVPVYDTVIPPGRHFGYIFEWAALAVFTLLGGFILQLRPLRQHR